MSDQCLEEHILLRTKTYFQHWWQWILNGVNNAAPMNCSWYFTLWNFKLLGYFSLYSMYIFLSPVRPSLECVFVNECPYSIKDVALIVNVHPYCAHISSWNTLPHHALSPHAEVEMQMTIGLVGIVIFIHGFNTVKCTIPQFFFQ